MNKKTCRHVRLGDNTPSLPSFIAAIRKNGAPPALLNIQAWPPCPACLPCSVTMFRYYVPLLIPVQLCISTLFYKRTIGKIKNYCRVYLLRYGPGFYLNRLIFSTTIYTMPIKFPIAGVLAKRKTGFTLVEVMIAVAIVCILSAIALPIYSNFLIRGHRAAAQAHLADIAMKQQQYLLDSRTYAQTLTQLHMSVPNSVSAYYTITIDNSVTPPLFSATATPIVGTRQASDVTLSINNVGAKLPAGSW